MNSASVLHAGFSRLCQLLLFKVSVCVSLSLITGAIKKGIQLMEVDKGRGSYFYLEERLVEVV